jgi:hypothetical protein
LRKENKESGNPASFNDELTDGTRDGADNTLDGYTPTTDDQPIVTGTLNQALIQRLRG